MEVVGTLWIVTWVMVCIFESYMIVYFLIKWNQIKYHRKANVIICIIAIAFASISRIYLAPYPIVYSTIALTIIFIVFSNLIARDIIRKNLSVLYIITIHYLINYIVYMIFNFNDNYELEYVTVDVIINMSELSKRFIVAILFYIVIMLSLKITGKIEKYNKISEFILSVAIPVICISSIASLALICKFIPVRIQEQLIFFIPFFRLFSYYFL